MIRFGAEATSRNKRQTRTQLHLARPLWMPVTPFKKFFCRKLKTFDPETWFKIFSVHQPAVNQVSVCPCGDEREAPIIFFDFSRGDHPCKDRPFSSGPRCH